MPRPIVRYGAQKRPANGDRHASIPSRYGRYKPGGAPPKGEKADQGDAAATGPAWLPGKKNPRKLRAGLPRAVAPRRVVPRREEMDAREYWQREAVRKTHICLSHLCINTIILPRRARDKHRKS